MGGSGEAGPRDSSFKGGILEWQALGRMDFIFVLSIAFVVHISFFYLLMLLKEKEKKQKTIHN